MSSYLKIFVNKDIFSIYLPENKGAEYRFFFSTSFSVFNTSVLCVGAKITSDSSAEIPKHGDTHVVKIHESHLGSR